MRLTVAQALVRFPRRADQSAVTVATAFFAGAWGSSGATVSAGFLGRALYTQESWYIAARNDDDEPSPPGARSSQPAAGLRLHDVDRPRATNLVTER